jgi:hypothetical protein
MAAQPFTEVLSQTPAKHHSFVPWAYVPTQWPGLCLSSESHTLSLPSQMDLLDNQAEARGPVSFLMNLEPNAQRRAFCIHRSIHSSLNQASFEDSSGIQHCYRSEPQELLGGSFTSRTS